MGDFLATESPDQGQPSRALINPHSPLTRRAGRERDPGLVHKIGAETQGPNGMIHNPDPLLPNLIYNVLSTTYRERVGTLNPLKEP